jgi:hypothetical protein
MAQTPLRVRGSPGQKPINLVTFFQKEFGKIRAILSRHSGDQSFFAHSSLFSRDLAGFRMQCSILPDSVPQ